MGRGRDFSLFEEELVINNYDKTIAEIEEILLQNGYERSRKSINRKLEKLRLDGKIGFRSENTKSRAYRQRRKRDVRRVPPKLTGGGWGEGTWSGSVSWEDNNKKED